jgi:long-subunit acyl-CoA synthetase (AMP-forming)
MHHRSQRPQTETMVSILPPAIRSALEDYTPPQIPLHRLLASGVRFYPESTAVVYQSANFIVSYEHRYGLCRRFAAGLVQRFNIRKGDRIAIFSRNYPEFMIAMFRKILKKELVNLL